MLGSMVGRNFVIYYCEDVGRGYDENVGKI